MPSMWQVNHKMGFPLEDKDTIEHQSVEQYKKTSKKLGIISENMAIQHEKYRELTKC